jgi:hypothetical protein
MHSSAAMAFVKSQWTFAVSLPTGKVRSQVFGLLSKTFFLADYPAGWSQWPA